MFFQTSIVDLSLEAHKIVKLAKKAQTKPVDLADQIDDEAKGEAPWDQVSAKKLAKIREIETLQLATERMLRRIAEQKNELIKDAKVFVGIDLYDHPTAVIVNACVRGDMVIDEVLDIWNEVVVGAGVNANFPGVVAYFRNKYAASFRDQDGRTSKPLPDYIKFESKIPLIVPNENESLEAWINEHRQTKKVIDTFEIKCKDAQLYTEGYRRAITDLDRKIEKWEGTAGKNALKAPKWKKDKLEALALVENLSKVIQKNQESITKVREIPVTSVNFELEVRKVAQEAIAAQGAIFAKNVLETILNDLNEQLDKALKNIKTTSKQAGIIDKIIEVISDLWKKFTKFVEFLKEKISELINASKKFDKLANIVS